MKKIIAVLGLLAAAQEGHALAATFDVTNGQTVTTAQTLASGQTGTIETGGKLSLAGSAVAISVTGNATIQNYGMLLDTGTGRAIRDNTGGLTLTLTNNVGAVIQTADADVIQMNKANSNVTVYNYGTMTSLNASAGGSQAIDFNAITTGSNSLYNYSTGVLQANEADAVRPGVNGFVYNDGLIKSTNNPGSTDGSDGIDAQTNSGITVVNATTGTATVAGTGTIEGARHGITGGNTDVTTSGAYVLNVTNNLGGTIQGDNGSGINIDGFNANELVTVVNHGTITGNGVSSDGDGVDVDGLVNITNTGTIQSLHAYNDASEGVTVGGGTIVNSGTIVGLNSATNADGTANTGVGRGITLAGIDKDPTTGLPIPIEGIYGNTSVTNSGLIRGQTTSGIAVTGAANAFTVDITNLAGGTIEGGGTTAAAITTGGNNATVINYGTITADSSNLAVDLGSGNSSLQILGGTAAINGNISGGTGSSALTITPGTGNSFNYSGDISNFSSVAIGAGTVTLAGIISGNGALTKSGSGTLTIDGSSNPFTGATNVASGALIVGDDSHANASLGGTVTVASGATIGGIGSIGSLNLLGTIAPGNNEGIGNFTVSGNAVLQSGSAYRIDALPNGISDRIVVGGSASLLGGSALALAQTGSWAPSTTYTVLTANGGVSGTFGSVSSNFAFLTPSLSYTANAVNLTLLRNDVGFADIAQTPNQRATAGALGAVGSTGPLYGALVTLDAASARSAFDQLSGESYASTKTALIDDSRYVRDAINRHLIGASNGADGVQNSSADGVTAWTSAWGYSGDHDSNGNAARLIDNGGGLLVGADLAVGSNTRFGAVVGYGENTADVSDRNASARTDSTSLGIYGSTSFGAFALRGGADYAWQDVDSTRRIGFDTYTDRLSADYHARTAQAFVEGGYRIDVSQSQQLEPFLNLARVQLQTDGVHESGGAAALDVAGDHTDVNTATLGLRDTWLIDSAAGGIRTYASLGFQQGWGDLTPTTNMRFASGSDSFAISGVPVAQHALAANFGLSFPIARNATVDASYLGQFASHAQDQAARVSLQVRF